MTATNLDYVTSVLASDKTAAICRLNDLLRTTGLGGRTVLTRGIAALPTDELDCVLRAVATFDAFTPDNDPYREHDCAALEAGSHYVLWKVDYYDTELEAYSPDPSDPALTCRVLTIMLGEEY